MQDRVGASALRGYTWASPLLPDAGPRTEPGDVQGRRGGASRWGRRPATDQRSGRPQCRVERGRRSSGRQRRGQVRTADRSAGGVDRCAPRTGARAAWTARRGQVRGRRGQHAADRSTDHRAPSGGDAGQRSGRAQESGGPRQEEPRQRDTEQATEASGDRAGAPGSARAAGRGRLPSAWVEESSSAAPRTASAGGSRVRMLGLPAHGRMKGPAGTSGEASAAARREPRRTGACTCPGLPASAARPGAAGPVAVGASGLRGVLPEGGSSPQAGGGLPGPGPLIRPEEGFQASLWPSLHSTPLPAGTCAACAPF